MKIRITPSLTEAERLAWVRFWTGSDHAHPRQHPALAEVERARGREPWFAFATLRGEVVAAAVLSLRPLLPRGRCSPEAVCLRGPAFDDLRVGRAFLAEIVRDLRERAVGRIRISPYWYGGESPGTEDLLAALGFQAVSGGTWDPSGWIDLAPPEDRILAGFSRTVRKQIREAPRRGVTFSCPTTQGEAAEARAAFARLRREHGLTPLRTREFEAMFEEALRGGDLGTLIVARRGPLFLGAIAFLRSRRTAHSLYFAVDPEAAELSGVSTVAPALWWEGIRWARSRGCARVDMEGRVEIPAEGAELEGFEQFKGRFRPAPVHRLAEHGLVCTPAVWSLQRVAASVSGLRRKALQAWSNRNSGHEVPAAPPPAFPSRPCGPPRDPDVARPRRRARPAGAGSSES